MRVALVFLLLSGCATVVSRSPSNVASNVCAKTSIADSAGASSTVLCEQLYTERPFVRVPATANKDGSLQVFGALIREGTSRVAIVDSVGSTFFLVDNAGKAVDLTIWMPKQSLRTNFTVYQITGLAKEVTVEKQDGTRVQESGIVVQQIRPAILISGCAIDSAFTGAWVGTVTKRLAEKRFDRFRATIPIHITAKSLVPGKAFEDLNVEQTREKPVALADGQIFRMNANIDNWNRELTEAGVTYPNLTNLGDANPFQGAADSRVGLYRLSSMHALGDAELVIEFPVGARGLTPQGMGDLTPLTPLNFIATTKRQNVSSVQLFPHATPTGFELDLESPEVLSSELFCQ